MNWKYFIGKTVNDVLSKIIYIKPSMLMFIPNGRFVALDIIRSREEINIVFDVGANIGQTALSFNKAFPKAKIYSFEPVKSTYDTLVKNCSNALNIRPENTALGTEKGTLNISINEDSEVNSLYNVTDRSSDFSEIILVESGNNYCASKNIQCIDLLKIDTEGFELHVLKGFDSSFLRDQIKFIYCEVGFDREDRYKTHFSDIEAYLKDLGFVTSGFYEPYRWGQSKLTLGFCNVLFCNLKNLKTN